MADGRAHLAALIGLRADECPELRDDALSLEVSLEFEQARALALDERPEIRALSWLALSLGASADAVHRSTRPSLSLGALAQAVNPTTAFTSDTNWQLGLSFSWPISDGGTADAREARERENRDAVLRDLESGLWRCRCMPLAPNRKLTSGSPLGTTSSADALQRSGRNRLEPPGRWMF